MSWPQIKQMTQINANNTKFENIEDESSLVVEEAGVLYSDSQYLLQQETYRIIGACINVHNELGRGFNEIIYKDALEIEFQIQQLQYDREKEFNVFYKGIQLKRTYHADFVVLDNVLLEVKASKEPLESFYRQTINYLKVSKLPIGLMVNFGEDKLHYKRVIFQHDKK